MARVSAGGPRWATREVWYPGYDYNATPGSRAVETDTIKNGYVFVFDPDATTDVASLPSAMVVKGSGNGRFCKNVMKPVTGFLQLFAGVLVEAPAEGYLGTTTRHDATPGYLGGIWLTLAYCAESVKCLVEDDISANEYTNMMGPLNDSWGLTIVTAVDEVVGHPLSNFADHTVPDFCQCKLGPAGHPIV